jgi:hypothetical protein
VIDAAAFFVYEIRDRRIVRDRCALGSVRSASSLMVSHPGWLGEPDHTCQRQEHDGSDH